MPGARWCGATRAAIRWSRWWRAATRPTTGFAPIAALPATPGLHRFVWDVHHERPAVAAFSYPIAAILGNTPRTPLGSWALPGAYTVRLTVDGRTQSQPLVVRMDPRVKTTAEGLALQHGTSRAIDAAMRRAAEALADIRARTPGTAALGEMEQRLARTRQPLGQLFGAVEAADVAPTPALLAAWKDASSALDALLAEWEKLKASLSPR